MIGVELVEPNTRTPAVGHTNAVLAEARAAGLLIGKGGLAGNVLRVTPPMTVTESEAQTALEILRDVLSKVYATAAVGH